MPISLEGLRTVIYPAPDLEDAKAWWSRLLGVDPYFDQPFYVGYSVAGYELALDPAGSVAAGAVTYWGVGDCDEAWSWLIDAGAAPREGVRDVGGSIRVATVVEPSGNVIGKSANA